MPPSITRAVCGGKARLIAAAFLLQFVAIVLLMVAKPYAG
jgi:hypothetical protein